jgi:hypothetical protein
MVLGWLSLLLFEMGDPHMGRHGPRTVWSRRTRAACIALVALMAVGLLACSVDQESNTTPDDQQRQRQVMSSGSLVHYGSLTEISAIADAIVIGRVGEFRRFEPRQFPSSMGTAPGMEHRGRDLYDFQVSEVLATSEHLTTPVTTGEGLLVGVSGTLPELRET